MWIRHSDFHFNFTICDILVKLSIVKHLYTLSERMQTFLELGDGYIRLVLDEIDIQSNTSGFGGLTKISFDAKYLAIEGNFPSMEVDVE